MRFSDAEADRVIGSIGLPSRKRYNSFVNGALDELKVGGDATRAAVFAQLAQAEATFLLEEQSVTLDGSLVTS